MYEYAEQIDDIVILCNGLVNGYKICVTAAKDEECNSIKLADKLKIKLDKVKSGRSAGYDVYRFADALSYEKCDQVKQGCEKGYKVIVTPGNFANDTDDELDEYDLED